MTEWPSVSRTVFDLPSSHYHCEFNNFKWPSPAVEATVAQFIEDLKSGEKRHLLLTGKSGQGKTHLVVAIYRWAVLQWGTMLCSFVHVPDFLNQVKASFSQQDERSPFLDVEDAKKILVLDDLFAREPTPWEVDHIIFRLINTAYTNSASLVVTTNQTIDQLQQVLKPHEVSRLLERAVHLHFIGEDHRLDLTP